MATTTSFLTVPEATTLREAMELIAQGLSDEDWLDHEAALVLNQPEASAESNGACYTTVNEFAANEKARAAARNKAIAMLQKPETLSATERRELETYLRELALKYGRPRRSQITKMFLTRNIPWLQLVWEWISNNADMLFWICFAVSVVTSFALSVTNNSVPTFTCSALIAVFSAACAIAAHRFTPTKSMGTQAQVNLRLFGPLTITMMLAFAFIWNVGQVPLGAGHEYKLVVDRQQKIVRVIDPGKRLLDNPSIPSVLVGDRVHALPATSVTDVTWDVVGVPGGGKLHLAVRSWCTVNPASLVGANINSLDWEQAELNRRVAAAVQKWADSYRLVDGKPTGTLASLDEAVKEAKTANFEVGIVTDPPPKIDWDKKPVVKEVEAGDKGSITVK